MSETFNFDVEQIRSACGAKWLQKPPKMPHLRGVGIDGREDLTAKAFIAIKGDTHDGHDHLQQAVDHGGQLLIVETAGASSRSLPSNIAAMQVENTRKALGRLAHAYRQSLLATKVIAVTGSSGKTTTKRLIHGALSASMHGVASPKSFNNDIGVPLAILQAKSSDKYLVLEIGSNSPGEIAHLAAIAEPDIAVITMIGRSHLEGLGSIEGVAREKGALLASLSADDGVAIVNADYPLLRPHLKPVRTKILFGEGAEADLRLTARDVEADRQVFEVNGRARFTLALPGRHNAINALAAVAVARRMGLDDEAIRAGLLDVKPEAMRMTPHIVGGVGGITFFNDAYNANPDSMAAALDTFAELAESGQRRIVVLGDMLELGADTTDLHREIGRRLIEIDRACRIDHAILIGENMSHAAAELHRAWGNHRVTQFAALNEKAITAAKKTIHKGDAALVKASRGMGLERLIEAFESSIKPARSGTAAVKMPV